MTRPTVFVLTDGSGRSGQSRLPSTTRILEQAGASKGSFYGRVTDSEAYNAILNHDFDLFVELARELARFLIEENVSRIAGDALEGYNPTHDVCRLVISAAMEMANRSGHHRLASFDFLLTGAPEKNAGPQELRIELDDAAFARKMAAARSYAELESEVNHALTVDSGRAFRVECLRAVKNEIGFGQNSKPYYEEYGERQVAAGHYRDIIRYREHIKPLAEALRQSLPTDQNRER